jgi:hypothetical protein
MPKAKKLARKRGKQPTHASVAPPVPATDGSNLSKRAMLCILQISRWSASTHDKFASQEIANIHNSDVKAGRYRKRLLPIGRNELGDVQKASDEARDFHYRNTLPWGQDGSRILPKENYFQYVDHMRTSRHEFNRAVKAFIAIYPSLVESSKQMLGTLYRETDYPTAAQLELKFAFNNLFLPFPDAKDFRVDVGEAEMAEIKKQIARQSTDAMSMAMRDAWNRLHEAVARMAERLAQPDAIFRDTLVGNLSELCDLLPKLNIGDDPALMTMCEQVKSKLTSKTPDELRENKGVREKTALDANAILQMMSSYVGNGQDAEVDGSSTSMSVTAAGG